MTNPRILSSDTERRFEDNCFRVWLNRVDAFADYEERRKYPVSEWRELFDAGESEKDAIAMLLFGKC